MRGLCAAAQLQARPKHVFVKADIVLVKRAK